MIYLILKKISQSTIIMSIILLVGCATPPVSIRLQPNLAMNQATHPFTNKTAWEINSQDHRIAQYLIEVTKGKGVAILVNESQSSRLIIENTLQQQWHNHGLNIKTNSADKINIQLIKLLVKVQQDPVVHNIDANIIINVELKTENKVFSKIFRSHSTKEALFSADIKKTGKQLNIQLSQLLSEIVQDPELNAKLQQL